MATKSYFDGNVLTTVEVPDRPLPVDVRGDTSVHALLAETAEKPADGSPVAIPEQPAPSTAATALQELKDSWSNGASPTQPSPPETDTPADPSIPNDTWTKAELGDYIVTNGGEKLGSNENKDVFLAKALGVYETAKLA